MDCIIVQLKFRVRNCRSEEHTSELQSRSDLVCRLLLEKKKNTNSIHPTWPEDNSYSASIFDLLFPLLAHTTPHTVGGGAIPTAFISNYPVNGRYATIGP